MGDTDEELQSRQFIFSLYAPHERHPSSPFTPDNERAYVYLYPISLLRLAEKLMEKI